MRFIIFPRLSARTTRRLLHVAILLIILVSFPSVVIQARAATGYTNALALLDANGTSRFESCPDPTIIRGQTAGDNYWYLYCTTDPQNGAAQSASRATGIPRSQFDFRFIPIFRSYDLVNWGYVGDLFSARPAWIAANGYAWAPEVQYFGGLYHLYYTGSVTTLSGGGSAIFVATSPNPAGPWTADGNPVVAPQLASGCTTAYRWIYDPAVVADAVTGQRYIFFGSYCGGISAQRLSTNGLTADPASETRITIANRYEGTAIVRHDGYYYLFASATNCCNGALTGYSVFVGRSANLLGPYVDREGASLLAGRVGGTPVLTMNGDQWVGPGHNALFTDAAGQDWTVYHAVNRNDPYFAGAPGFTKRPALMDPVDWYEGWPTIHGGQGPSDTVQPGPAAQPGDRPAYLPRHESADETLGSLVPGASDEFNPAANLQPQWSWVRPPASSTYGLTDGTFRFDVQNAELYVDSNNASVLTEAAPAAEYTVETRLKLNVPPEGCCQNFVQAGLVIYGDDDDYLKLVHVSIGETRQIEFGKEVSAIPPPGVQRYGNTVLSSPTDWTYLRITKRIAAGEERYTAYSSHDGQLWMRGGTWTHALGTNARIGLVAMHNGTGFTANFDYVHVYSNTVIIPQPTRHPDGMGAPRAQPNLPIVTPAPAPPLVAPSPPLRPSVPSIPLAPRITPAMQTPLGTRTTATIAPQPARH